MKVNVEDESNNAMFSNYIRNVSMEDHEIMVSFDVTSFRTNIPITDALTIRIILTMMISFLGKRLYIKTSFLI